MKYLVPPSKKYTDTFFTDTVIRTVILGIKIKNEIALRGLTRVL